MATALPPVDTNVTIPAAILKAGKDADAIHQAAYQTQPEPDPEPAPEPTLEPAPEPTPEPAPATPEPAPPRVAVPETGEHGSWEHRYLAMKGRFDQSQQTLGQMQEQMSELGDELVRTQQALQMARAGLAGIQQPRQQRAAPPPSSITDADVDTYGPELVEFVTRAARGAVAPDLDRVDKHVRQTAQTAKQLAQQRMEADLDGRLPGWRDINVSQRFKNWASLRDIYSGQVRRNLIGDAASAADAPRVAAFFQAFLAEEQATGQDPAPQHQPLDNPAPRQAAVPLESLAAPGRAKPAAGVTPNAADKPVFTRAQISRFYSNEGRAAYVGRDDDRKRDEQEIYSAQREGRVR